MNRNLAGVPLLLVAAALCISGAVRVAQDGTSEGYALLSAGLVLLGAWVAMDVVTRRHKDDKDDKDDKAL